MYCTVHIGMTLKESQPAGYNQRNMIHLCWWQGSGIRPHLSFPWKHNTPLRRRLWLCALLCCMAVTMKYQNSEQVSINVRKTSHETGDILLMWTQMRDLCLWLGAVHTDKKSTKIKYQRVQFNELIALFLCFRCTFIVVMITNNCKDIKRELSLCRRNHPKTKPCVSVCCVDFLKNALDSHTFTLLFLIIIVDVTGVTLSLLWLVAQKCERASRS